MTTIEAVGKLKKLGFRVYSPQLHNENYRLWSPRGFCWGEYSARELIKSAESQTSRDWLSPFSKWIERRKERRQGKLEVCNC